MPSSFARRRTAGLARTLACDLAQRRGAPAGRAAHGGDTGGGGAAFLDRFGRVVDIARIGRLDLDPLLHHGSLRRRRRSGRLGHLALGLEHHQRRADRDHVADLARHLEHRARDRAFHLDRRLVGHHVGKPAVFLDPVADLDVPGDDLGLGDALADVRQPEYEAPHPSGLQQLVDRLADADRPGEIGPFEAVRIGVSKPVTRSTGASRW